MQKVLVTGISKGIGRSICEVLIGEGYYVIGTYNTGEKEAEELLSKYNGDLEIVQVDLSDRDATYEFIEEISDEKFYAIVNNAGSINFEKWEDMNINTWDEMLEVNLTAPAIIMSQLKDNIEDNGRIVNIASTDGMVGSTTSIAYSVAKAGLINLTKSMTNVFADKKVNVNSISPRFVGEGMDSPAIEDAKWINPFNRTAEYVEIANVVKFLLSEDSSFINGENIIVDGGTSAVDYFLKKESELVD